MTQDRRSGNTEKSAPQDAGRVLSPVDVSAERVRGDVAEERLRDRGHGLLDRREARELAVDPSLFPGANAVVEPGGDLEPPTSSAKTKNRAARISPSESSH